MDPPPFNFNSAGTLGKTQPVAPPGSFSRNKKIVISVYSAPSAFGAAVPKVAFGAGSLFGKPSLHAQAAAKQDAPPEPKPSVSLASSSSLASRLTMVGKNKPPVLKAKRDSSDDKVPNLQEGAFAIPSRLKEGGKSTIGPFTFRKRGATGEAQKRLVEPKPIRPSQRVGFQFGQPNNEVKSLFGKPKPVVEEGHNETDHAVKMEGPSGLFSGSFGSTSKGFGGLSNEKTSSFKPIADRTWKPSSRLSPAPESRPQLKTGSEEAKLIQKLAGLRGQKCPEDYDKYILLDERDKILCQLREVNSPLIQRLERCEEMCTEKERYQRIVQKGVSPFECDEETGDVSHEMMVKQYARSAADQERPLPHELRSEKIMNHAMCYLLHNVLDEFPEFAEQRAAWYNFLWNRTRALRKEVTQLSLSDSLALNLVERCTRLHILFGYVLCDLETEYFDAAMNNETLGKCLQTLRHFYEDFEKRGIPCVNEAEFRSYDVMLHMNDTNILSQVLSYRSEVRQSKSVRLALQLASAFRDKNYCRFFRVLQTDASYLQCCVAHKLFNITRSNAVSIMTNSYGRNTFPLEKLQRILAFDKVEDLTSMLHTYGLRTEGTDYVMLSKDDLTLNETIPLTTYDWIDRKSTGKFSSAVYGPDLFQFIASRCDVSNSFNHHQEYTHDRVLEAVLNESDVPITINDASSSFAVSSGSLQAQATMEQRQKAEAERLKRVRVAEREKLIEKLTSGVVDQVVYGIVDEEVRKAKIVRKQMVAMENARQRKAEAERIRLEQEEIRMNKEKEIARNLAMKVEKEVAEKQLKKIAEEELKREKHDRERRLARSITEKFWKEVLKSIDGRVKSICEDMVNEKEAILERLGVFRDRMSKQWLLQFWNRWRDWVQIKKEAKLRKLDMIRRCVPRWESEEIAKNLNEKYGSSSQNTSPVCPMLNRSSNHIKLKIFKVKRQNRMVRDAFTKWRSSARQIKHKRMSAQEKQRREEEFYRRFEKSTKIETRYKFNAPDDWMMSERKSHESVLKDKQPSYSCVTNSSFQCPDTSLYVARRYLEDWEPSTELPEDVKDKLKRKRESFENVCEEHLSKKKRDEVYFSWSFIFLIVIFIEVKKEDLYLKKVTGEADALLDETLRYTAELDRMMADIKSRRVDEL
ncbi:Protein CBG17718 [Caenorhabditis briggsae]|uniref:Protein CBG17718 n=1 Tax=Caenorhabditis briggsae TaxID=6238 RepID=A8XRG2_CAEBR|nr:Protein CBG17718 [Caenorhabditis briggsae]CAP35236.2 Protein CBG17718 [Caenorhabditis briggsae]